MANFEDAALEETVPALFLDGDTMFPDDSTHTLQARVRELEQDGQEAMQTIGRLHGEITSLQGQVASVIEAFGLDDECTVTEVIGLARDYVHACKTLSAPKGTLDIELDKCVDQHIEMCDERIKLVELLGSNDILAEVIRLKTKLVELLKSP